ncbi:MAG: magnesium transporter [Alphaproteobacteria bacterium]|nr:magnesium transporter [Alphaproteobacteria bacterium]
MSEQVCNSDEQNREGSLGLTHETISEVVDALYSDNEQVVRESVLSMHHSEQADLIEHLNQEERRKLLVVIGTHFDPEILPELDEVVYDEIVGELGFDNLAAAVEELDSDDAVSLIEQLEEDAQGKVLKALSSEDRAFIEQGLSYPEDSAGRLMQREVVVAPSHWTVRETIDFLCESTELPDYFYDVFVVNPKFQPIGRIDTCTLLTADRTAFISDIMKSDIHPLPATMDQEEVAFLFRQMDWITAMVVDETGRLLGAITIDDVVDVIDEEASDDMLSLAGVGESDLYRDVINTSRVRFSWLFLNLGAALIASSVVGLFEHTLEKVIALAILMPVVASMGGNAGHQTLAVVVRALAMKELTAGNALRIVGKEALVGCLNGFLFALLAGSVVCWWFDNMNLGLVIGLAMIINLFLAGLAGIVIPLTLSNLKIDPAVSSGVFLTAITDVAGFFVFLGLASLLLL